jgi:hypothetical protein
LNVGPISFSGGKKKDAPVVGDEPRITPVSIVTNSTAKIITAQIKENMAE